MSGFSKVSDFLCTATQSRLQRTLPSSQASMSPCSSIYLHHHLNWSAIFRIVICCLGQVWAGLDTLGTKLLSATMIGPTLNDGNEVTHIWFSMIPFMGNWWTRDVGPGTFIISLCITCIRFTSPPFMSSLQSNKWQILKDYTNIMQLSRCLPTCYRRTHHH